MIVNIQVREINFKLDNAVMLEGSLPMDMPIFRDIWETCLRLSDYENRLREINEFNG